MITAHIAGHDFREGRCTACGRLWFDVQHITLADAGQDGYAHSGKLTTYECTQIMDAKAAQDARMTAVLAG